MMRYEKPVVVHLNAMARRAVGQNPLGCVSGEDTGETSSPTCGTGGIAYGGCVPGGTAGTLQSCASGNAATGGDCLSGTAVGPGFYCEAGTAGGNDPYGCTAGPSYVLG